MDYPKFSDLLGKVLTRVELHDDDDDDEIKFHTTDGEVFKLWHDADCCESVTIDEIHGDLDDLVGSPIVVAEEVTADDEQWTSSDDPVIQAERCRARCLGETRDADDSFTWTFYKLATIKGSVTIRWFGESNGYYSESVDFEKVK